jgi:hypothetical protein
VAHGGIERAYQTLTFRSLTTTCHPHSHAGGPLCAPPLDAAHPSAARGSTFSTHPRSCYPSRDKTLRMNDRAPGRAAVS